MQVENYEINGFLIDSFNQHNLEVGKTQGICPLCSHTRKPKNQKAKCCSYDWERGLGTCHNCNSTLKIKLLNGLKIEVYLKGLWTILKSVKVLSICHKLARKRILSNLIT